VVVNYSAFNVLSKTKSAMQSIVDKATPVSDEPLPADQAFSYSVSAIDANTNINTELACVHPNFTKKFIVFNFPLWKVNITKFCTLDINEKFVVIKIIFHQ
jgi:hypothetical protein